MKQELTIGESQFRAYQARIGRPFAHKAYQTELTSLREQLKTGSPA